MTHALVRVYATVRDHLDAYSVADHLVPDLMQNPRWIPELEAEAIPLQRVFLAEKWLAARLHYGHVDPREAGVGNIVNCGAAMYMAPVGLVNAANPAGAYAEALDIAGAHQSSYGREAAGVFAAAVAAACVPGATPDSVVAACLALAKDGTRTAIEKVCEVAAGYADFESALGPLREAVAPYDTVGPDYRAPSLDARRPSRTKAIEELPVALGMLVVSGGDFRHAVLGSVNYGRDCDSIATMAGAVAGALGSTVPQDWSKTVAEASRLDLWEPATTLTAVTREVFERDVLRRRAHEAAFSEIGGRGAPTDLGPAGGPARPRAAPGRPGRPRTVGDRGALAGGGRRGGTGTGGRVRRTPLPLPPVARGGPAGRTGRSAQPVGGPGAHRPDTHQGPVPQLAHRTDDFPAPPGRLRGRLAGPRRRLPARQTRGEDHPRRHPPTRPRHRQLAPHLLLHRPGRPPPTSSPPTPGTAAQPPPPWPRTSTACPRTTTSTTPC